MDFAKVSAMKVTTKQLMTPCTYARVKNTSINYFSF